MTCNTIVFLLALNNSMLEIILLASIVILLCTFFYKQAATEFRINQIEWSQVSHLNSLFTEKLPIVVRSISPTTFWSVKDAMQRPAYDKISVFNEMSLTEWITTYHKTNPICPWRYSHAEKIARISGISVWAAKWFNPAVLGYHKFWTFPKYHCWAGDKGLHKTMSWTCLLSTEGEIHVTIMPESMEQFLPIDWLNRFPAQMGQKDTPFFKELKYIDIVLRPGTALFMPPHWFMSWVSSEGATSSERTSNVIKENTEGTTAMACTISYHTLISYAAFQMSPVVQR